MTKAVHRINHPELYKDFDELRMKYLYCNNGYFADVDGNIYNRKGRRLRTRSHLNYDMVSIPIKGVIEHLLVHRVIALTFLPNPNNLPQVNHKDGNKKNNAVNNLEWVTASENQKHAFKHLGKTAKGVRNSQHKLNENDVRKVMSLHENGKHYADIAKVFNVAPTTIYCIIGGYSWNHITHIKSKRKQKP